MVVRLETVRKVRKDSPFRLRLSIRSSLGEVCVHRSPPRRSLAFVLAGSLALFALSCSSGPKLYPVKGYVYHGETPAEGANVVFHLKDAPPNTPTSSGTVQSDGSFQLSTYPHGDGAPPGEYVVLVTWYPPDSRGLDNPKNKLPAKYALAESPLRATVQAGPTELEPFRIPKQK
jgi:hypothetical protein